MRDFFRRLAGRAAGRYRKMSIQMVISLSFTAVAVVGMLFMGGSLYLWMSGTASAMVEESSQKVLAQVNLNLDSYLRRMMRVSDTMYYRVIKDADLGQDDLMPGMVCKVDIADSSRYPSGIVVPNNCIQIDYSGHAFVWVAHDGVAAKRRIRVGGLTEKGTLVSQGLEKGELLIVEGSQKVSEGSKIVVK